MRPVAEKILKQAYGSIGIEIKITEYPALRAIISANEGIVDGELMRVQGVEKKYPNLNMIPVYLAKVEGVVFTRNLSFQVEGFDSLKPYSIAVRRGVKFAVRRTEGMNRIIVDSLDRAFLLLNRERVDVVIATRLTGMLELKRTQYQKIKVLEPPLLRTYLYHYLHSKHKVLIPKVSASLQDMQMDGTINKIRDQFIEELLNRE